MMRMSSIKYGFTFLIGMIIIHTTNGQDQTTTLEQVEDRAEDAKLFYRNIQTGLHLDLIEEIEKGLLDPSSEVSSIYMLSLQAASRLSRIEQPNGDIQGTELLQDTLKNFISGDDPKLAADAGLTLLSIAEKDVELEQFIYRELLESNKINSSDVNSSAKFRLIQRMSYETIYTDEYRSWLLSSITSTSGSIAEAAALSFDGKDNLPADLLSVLIEQLQRPDAYANPNILRLIKDNIGVAEVSPYISQLENMKEQILSQLQLPIIERTLQLFNAEFSMQLIDEILGKIR